MTHPTDSPQNGASSFRSYPAWLATLDEAALLRLFTLRPDVALPPPPTVSSLATRMRLRASLARAAAQLTGAQVALVTAVARHPGPIPTAELAGLSPADTGDPGDPADIERLVELALLYPAVEGHLAVVPELLSALPPEFHDLRRDPALTREQADALITGLDVRERKVLDTLARSGLVGSTKDAAHDADPARPIPRLLAAGLLSRVDEATVRLPLTVFEAITGQDQIVTTTPPALPAPPSPVGVDADDADTAAQHAIDTAGLATGLEVVRRVDALIDALGTTPAAVLRAGGVGIREVTRLAKLLGEPAEEVASLVSLAEASGLLGVGEPDPLPAGGEGHNFLAPTPAADSWQASSLSARWVGLVAGWLASPWAPWETAAAVGKQGVNLLAGDNRHDRLPAARALNLRPFIEYAAPLSATQARDWLSFHRPLLLLRQAPGTVANVVREAEALGALALGRATSALTALLGGESADQVAAAVEALAPATVEEVIIQADMTVLAPGPLPPALAAELGLLADLESPGLAAVYRISEESLSRALDAGRSAADLRAFLSAHAIGTVPQAVEFLIDEAARHHGVLRGGPARSYLRCDEEADLTAALHAAGPGLGLRRIAPTVAISPRPLAEVIAALQAAGFHPAAEDEAGLRVDVRPQPARVPSVAARQRRQTRQPQQDQLTHAVRALLGTGDSGSGGGGGGPAGGPAPDDRARGLSDLLGGLAEAARGGRRVRLRVVDKQSQQRTLVVKPVRLEAGQLDALDESGAARRIAVARISGWELA